MEEGDVQHQSSVVKSCPFSPGILQEPESNIISMKTPPNRPVTTAELVLITATVIKLNLLLSGPTVGDACGPPWVLPGRFPASYSLFVSGLSFHTISIVENSVGLDNSVENTLCPGR